MNYKKPTCHCGTELVLSLDYVYRGERRISSHGIPLKNKCNKPLDDLTPYDPHEYLRCPECTSRFELSYNSEDRIIKIDDMKPHPNDTGMS